MMICARKPNRLIKKQEKITEKSHRVQKITEKQRFIAKPCYYSDGATIVMGMVILVLTLTLTVADDYK